MFSGHINFNSENDINLLLLGDAGVGKSTFINSISNYFNFPSFKAAQKGEINVLIPEKLNLTNSNIFGNANKNCAAATQVEVYLFPIKVDGKVINLRLVNTPGVGDFRGIEQDKENLDNILAYLSTLKKLHGICLFMKANQSSFTVFVEYCLKEILSRLDKSASNNIIFITTYSKLALYSIGETRRHCLEKLVDSVKLRSPHVSIPLTDCNTFYLDNEAFKVLLEMKQGRILQKYEIKRLSEIWTESSNECRRLLTYLIGDSKTQPLKPHEVENTITVNEVRSLIQQLAIPIAEVSQNIHDNLIVLDRHKKNLSRENQSLNELKQQLFIPCVELKVKELTRPVTVCTDAKCVEVVKVNDVTNDWHYKQRCHNPCGLSNIPREVVGDPGLISCAAMGGTENCTQCGCHYTVHMHIYKETEKVQSQRENEILKAAIRSKKDIRDKIEQVIMEVNKIMNELENELDIISANVAKFSYFLEDHAVTLFNDAYSDYIKLLMKNEKHLGNDADSAVIEKLQKLLDKHEQLQKTFQESQNKFQHETFDLSPISIKQSINELYNLKHTGKKIEELVEKSNACRQKELQQNFNCVVSQQIDWNANKIFNQNETYDAADNSKIYSDSDIDSNGKASKKSSQSKESYYSEQYYSSFDFDNKYEDPDDDYDLSTSHGQLDNSDDQKSLISSKSNASSHTSRKQTKSSKSEYSFSGRFSPKLSVNSSKSVERSHRRKSNDEYGQNYSRKQPQERHTNVTEYPSGNYNSTAPQVNIYVRDNIFYVGNEALSHLVDPLCKTFQSGSPTNAHNSKNYYSSFPECNSNFANLTNSKKIKKYLDEASKIIQDLQPLLPKSYTANNSSAYNKSAKKKSSINCTSSHKTSLKPDDIPEGALKRKEYEPCDVNKKSGTLKNFEKILTEMQTENEKFNKILNNLAKYAVFLKNTSKARDPFKKHVLALLSAFKDNNEIENVEKLESLLQVYAEIKSDISENESPTIPEHEFSNEDIQKAVRKLREIQQRQHFLKKLLKF